MDNTTRDPRIDPQTGDVVMSRSVAFVVWERNGDHVAYFTVGIGGGPPHPTRLSVSDWAVFSASDTVSVVGGVRVSE